MTKQATVHVCEAVVEKLLARISLDEAEKSHLASCESCMGEVIRVLDQRRQESDLKGNRLVPSQRALELIEKGRRTFEREFGISLPRNGATEF